MDKRGLLTRLHHKHIPRVQILVNIAVCVNVIERLQHITRNVGKPTLRVQPDTGNHLQQRKVAAFDDEIESILVFERIAHERNIRMPQIHQLAGFLQPAFAYLGVGAVVRQDDFRNQRIAPLVTALVNDPEAAAPEFVTDVVFPVTMRNHFTFFRQAETAWLAYRDGALENRYASFKRIRRKNR